MKLLWRKLQKKAAPAFTLVEIKDSKILHTFHLMTMSSAVTCTLLIRPLTIVF